MAWALTGGNEPARTAGGVRQMSLRRAITRAEIASGLVGSHRPLNLSALKHVDCRSRDRFGPW